MEVSDPILISVITSHPHLSETDLRALETWWLADRTPGEGIVEFLVRQGVFLRDASRTLEMLRRGVLTYLDPRRVFGDHGHRRLREFTVRLGFSESRTGGFAAAVPGSRRPSPPTGAAVSPAAGPPGSRLKEVRDWLARRAEVKQAKSPPPVEVPPEPPAQYTGSVFKKDPPSRPPLSSAPDRLGTAFDRSRFPEAGDDCGKYLLTEEIGRGAAAVVFRAYHRPLNNTVAIKVLRLNRAAGLTQEQAQLLDGLRREAQLLARFNHPHLVRVFDLVEDTPYPFVVLEYVDGLNLDELLRHTGRLRLDRAARLVAAVAEGLAAAQRKTGLVHRDVKPGNILLARDGTIKLADLGLAVVADTRRQMQGQSDPNVIVGTAGYIAPEQCHGAAVDFRTDIYALGATFYHAVVGDMPFRGRNRLEIMLKHTREEPVPPHHLVTGLSPEASDVILKMMRKNPDERHQSYEELLSELQALQTGSVTEICLPQPSVVAHPSV